jgi:hypothetical protein
MLPLNEDRVRKSATVLANANELVAHVIRNVAGNDISNTLNGSNVTLNTLRTLAQSRFKRHFECRETK